MRKLYLLVFSLFLLTNCASQSRSVSDELPPPPDQRLADYKQAIPMEWKLSNGLTVLFMRDDEIPLMRGTLYIPGGSLWESPAMRGVTEVMGQQMRAGGAGQLDADALDLELEKLAAAVASEYGGEFGSVSFSCLSSDFQRVFEIFRDVVRDPRFQQDRLDLWKGQALEGIRRRVDDPSTVAGLAFKQLLFGDTPLGGVMVKDDVQNISRLALLRTHRAMVQPSNAYLSIVGNVELADVKAAVERAFGDWVGEKEVLPPPSIDFTPEPGIYFIQLPFSQSTVYMGHQGPERLSKDHIALEGFNNIFGSGDFGSRLMKRIRSELGLVYSIFGGVMPGFPIGQTIMVLQTKSESTAPAILESFKSLDDMQRSLVGSEELERVKKSVENSFIFRLDTPDDLARRVVLLRLLKYPSDYDQTYLPRVRAMTAEEVQTVALKRWDATKMVIVVVGNENAYNALEQRVRVREYPVNILKRCVFDEKLRSCS